MPDRRSLPRTGHERRGGRLVVAIGVSALVFAVALALAEGVMRIAGWRPPGLYTNLRYENDPLSGPWPLPSQRVFAQGVCFDVRSIHINRFGMRDRERDLGRRGFRIALVGDSMIQGLQVDDSQTVSHRLELLLNARAEVLNFGVSSTGTAVQLLSYRKRIRPFRPDVVLLMFYVGNDIADNLPALKRMYDPAMAALSPYLLLDEQGRLKDLPEPGRWRRTSAIVAALNSTALGQWAYYAWTRRSLWRATAPEPADRDLRPSALWTEAWRITEQVIERFHSEVERDGARFGVVVIPADMRELGRIGAIDPETRGAVDRLRRLSGHLGFPLLDLSITFRDRVRSRGPSGLAYPCDGHWTPLAHAEAASALHAFVSEQRWLQ